MFAAFADLAVSVVPVGVVVGQEYPGFLLYAASWDLGVAAWGSLFGGGPVSLVRFVLSPWGIC